MFDAGSKRDILKEIKKGGGVAAPSPTSKILRKMDMFGEYKITKEMSREIFSDENLIRMDMTNSYGLISNTFDRADDIVAEIRHEIEVHGTV